MGDNQGYPAMYRRKSQGGIRTMIVGRAVCGAQARHDCHRMAMPAATRGLR